MKKIRNLLVILLTVLSIQTEAARHPGSSSRLEQVKTTTEIAVDSLKEKARNLNTDSLATTVIITTHPDREATMRARDSIGSINETRHHFSISNDDFEEIMGVMFILLLMMLFPAVIVLGCVFIITRSKSRLKRQRYELIRHCVDAGSPLPKAFYQNELPQPTNYLRSGIVWLGWGLSATVLYALDNENFFLALGIVLIFIGLSRLALFRRLSKKQPRDNEYKSAETNRDKSDESAGC